MSYRLFVLVSLLVVAVSFNCVQAQVNVVTEPEGLSRDKLVVEYSADYIGRYRPDTALDMVHQLPGFQLDDGEQIRGFASAIGNILFNDKYTSLRTRTVYDGIRDGSTLDFTSLRERHIGYRFVLSMSGNY